MTYRESELPERSVVLRTTEEPVVCVADLLLHHPFVPLGRQVLRWVETRSQRQSVNRCARELKEQLVAHARTLLRSERSRKLVGGWVRYAHLDVDEGAAPQLLRLERLTVHSRRCLDRTCKHHIT